ncbi:MAG: PKD domain-containing protein, partial [Thermoplasmata archaeon]
SMAIANAPPVATITNASTGHSDIIVGDNVTFAGTGTDKGTSDTLTYKWDLGDGNTSTSASTVHAYEKAGNYTVKFTVTDNDGAATTVSKVLWVKSMATVTSGGQDLIDDAPASSFDKKQDQDHISGLFSDLLDALATESANQIESRIHVLKVQVDNKVTDEDLKQEILDLLDNLESNT